MKPSKLRLSDVLVVCYLEHRRRVIALCMFYNICGNTYHALDAALTGDRILASLTCQCVSVYPRYLDVPFSRTEQISWSFIPACSR